MCNYILKKTVFQYSLLMIFQVYFQIKYGDEIMTKDFIILDRDISVFNKIFIYKYLTELLR